MENISSYSYFLMDQFLESFQLNEGVDYEWDLKNNVEIDHRKGIKIDKKNNTVTWLEESIKKSDNKKNWLKRLLNKISSFNVKKRKVLLSLAIPLLLGFLSSSDIMSVANESENKEIITPETAELITVVLDEVNVVYYQRTFDRFIDSLEYKESRHNWKAINSLGYMGLYQIGSEALEDISKRSNDPDLKGIHLRVTPSEFRKNPNIFPPELQKKAFFQLLRNNRHYLRNFKDYIGKTIGGIKITESGMLAAAHLVGNGSVKQFLRSGGKIDKKDANGVPCSHYLEFFQGYELDI